MKSVLNLREKWANENKIDSMKEAFEKFVQKEEYCWVWLGSKKGRINMDYGNFTFRGKGMMAHRASYNIYKGEIPDGVLVLHKCDVPSCVNPDHLWLGSYLDNQRDKMAKGRGTCEKLSPEKVSMIKGLLRMGVLGTRICNDFGISRTTLCSIKKGRTWKDIE